MTPEKDKYYIVKEPDEELHQVLVGHSRQGKITALSKVLPNRLIAYKIFINKNNQSQVLREGVGESKQYEEVIQRFAEEFLIPFGSNWNKVEPVIIERENG